MNIKLNYYAILGVEKDSSSKQIKKKYYDLSKIHHPDKGGDPVNFDIICEAYKVLISENRAKYDLKSEYGANFDESTLLNDFAYSDYNKGFSKEAYDKAAEVSLNVMIEVDDDFDGSVEYNRYIVCNTCKGTGMDNSNRIKIETPTGFYYIESDDVCYYCEGEAVDSNGKTCKYCKGIGKLGAGMCKTCNGTKRILGKQKVNSIVLNDGFRIVEYMGHYSPDGKARGHLWVMHKNEKNKK